MRPNPQLTRMGLLLLGLVLPVVAGPYSAGLNDPVNAHDAPVPGFVGPHGIGKARLFTYDWDEDGEEIYENPANYLNPVFFGWASETTSYNPTPSVPLSLMDPAYGLGPVSGDHFDVVSLGDRTQSGINSAAPPGSITLAFARPIRNLSGADFVVFENGYIAQEDMGGAGVGGVFAELAYVEVSSDGVIFQRLPATSLNGPPQVYPETGSALATIDPTNVHNLAGKHVNAYGNSWGTPFDIASTGLPQITHVRLVDIPGNGAYKDSGDRPIYDAWFSTSGFDLDAVGAISVSMTYSGWPQLALLPVGKRGPADDPDGDGVPNLLEYAAGTLPWQADAVLPVIASGPGGMTFSFQRDERAGDLRYEVQASDDLAGWVTFASSSGGAALQAVPGHAPVITDVSAGTIQSVGVIRRTSVGETPPPGSTKRFYRLKVTLSP